jgi:hypothetical protein
MILRGVAGRLLQDPHSLQELRRQPERAECGPGTYGIHYIAAIEER